MAEYNSNYGSNNNGGYGNNSNNDRNDITTRNNRYRNATAKIPCALEVTYYGEMVRLGFVPPLPEANRGERRMFDYDNTILTSLSRKKCNELYLKYEEVILPAIKAKEQKFVSVEIGDAKNHIGISTGMNLSDDGEPHPCIILIRNIDPDTHKSTDVILYEFTKSSVFTDYNPVTGTYIEEKVNDELDLFMKDLNTFSGAMSKAYVHSSRVVDRAYKDLISDAIKSIQDKMGIQRAGGVRNGNSNYNTSGLGYSNIFGEDNGAMNAPATSIENADDLADALG